jgi:hypothetical protein
MMNTEPTERDTTIDSISEDRLITSSSSTGELQIHEYERLRDDWSPR